MFGKIKMRFLKKSIKIKAQARPIQTRVVPWRPQEEKNKQRNM